MVELRMLVFFDDPDRSGATPAKSGSQLLKTLSTSDTASGNSQAFSLLLWLLWRLWLLWLLWLNLRCPLGFTSAGKMRAGMAVSAITCAPQQHGGMARRCIKSDCNLT